MKIDQPKRPGEVRRTQAQRASKRTGASSKAFTSHLGDDQASGVGSTPRPLSGLDAPTANSVDSLLALQGASWVGDRERRHAVAWARDALDILEALVLALSEGQIPASLQTQLRDVLDRERPVMTDPELGSLLEAIVLRARVEWQKLQRDDEEPS